MSAGCGLAYIYKPPNKGGHRAREESFPFRNVVPETLDPSPRSRDGRQQSPVGSVREVLERRKLLPVGKVQRFAARVVKGARLNACHLARDHVLSDETRDGNHGQPAVVQLLALDLLPAVPRGVVVLDDDALPAEDVPRAVRRGLADVGGQPLKAHDGEDDLPHASHRQLGDVD